jgi:hypothetical protein
MRIPGDHEPSCRPIAFMKTHQFTYKCRQCSLAFVFRVRHPDALEDPKGAVEAACYSPAALVPLYRVHDCTDGSFGIGDLIGARKVG